MGTDILGNLQRLGTPWLLPRLQLVGLLRELHYGLRAGPRVQQQWERPVVLPELRLVRIGRCPMGQRFGNTGDTCDLARAAGRVHRRLELIAEIGEYVMMVLPPRLNSAGLFWWGLGVSISGIALNGALAARIGGAYPSEQAAAFIATFGMAMTNLFAFAQLFGMSLLAGSFIVRALENGSRDAAHPMDGSTDETH